MILHYRSVDFSLRSIDIETGNPTLDPIEELGCDHLEAEKEFVLTSVGNGEAILVWKVDQSKNELILIDEIEVQ